MFAKANLNHEVAKDKEINNGNQSIEKMDEEVIKNKNYLEDSD